MPPYALSSKDLGEFLYLRGLRLIREADRQRLVLRASRKPGPCVPLPARDSNPLSRAKVRLIHNVFTPSSKESHG